MHIFLLSTLKRSGSLSPFVPAASYISLFFLSLDVFIWNWIVCKLCMHTTRITRNVNITWETFFRWGKKTITKKNANETLCELKDGRTDIQNQNYENIPSPIKCGEKWMQNAEREREKNSDQPNEEFGLRIRCVNFIFIFIFCLSISQRFIVIDLTGRYISRSLFVCHLMLIAHCQALMKHTRKTGEKIKILTLSLMAVCVNG